MTLTVLLVGGNVALCPSSSLPSLLELPCTGDTCLSRKRRSSLEMWEVNSVLMVEIILCSIIKEVHKGPE